MNSASVRPACLSTERSVSVASARCIGTMTDRPSPRSCTWLPAGSPARTRPWPEQRCPLHRRRPAAPGSRREFDGGDDRRLDGLGQGFVLEVQLECFSKIGESVVGRATLAGHLNLQSAGDVPPIFVRDCRRELHNRQITTSRFTLWQRTHLEVAGQRSGAPGRIRTCDARFRKPTLYPLSYRGDPWHVCQPTQTASWMSLHPPPTLDVPAGSRGPGCRPRQDVSAPTRPGARWRPDAASRSREFSPLAGTVGGEEMGLFQRAHEIVEAKANRALDAAERPDEMLDLSYEKMLEQITQVKRSLVDIAASRKQLELQEQQLQHSVDHLQDQAKQALAAGREDLAKEALARKATAQAQIDAMEPQHQQLSEEEEKLEQTLATLQQRVNQFRSQKEVLKAQYSASKAMSSVDESVAGISKSLGDSGAALQRAQDKIANMQARSGALDELLESGALEDVGGGDDDIQRELNEVATKSNVDQELAALKAQMSVAGEIESGSSSSS